MWNNVNFMYFLSEMIDGKVNRQKNPNEKGEKETKQSKLGMKNREKKWEKETKQQNSTTEVH